GDLFRSLADQRDHEVHFGIVRDDPVGYLLENRCLPRLGWGNDQSALTAADGHYKIDEALGDGVGVGLESKHAIREDRGERFEIRPPSGDLRIQPVDCLDSEEAVVLLAVFGRPYLAR